MALPDLLIWGPIREGALPQHKIVAQFHRTLPIGIAFLERALKSGSITEIKDSWSMSITSLEAALHMRPFSGPAPHSLSVHRVVLKMSLDPFPLVSHPNTVSSCLSIKKASRVGVTPLTPDTSSMEKTSSPASIVPQLLVLGVELPLCRTSCAVHCAPEVSPVPIVVGEALQHRDQPHQPPCRPGQSRHHVPHHPQ